MKILDCKEFEIHVPTSGGKAGKGKNVTGSVQVRCRSQIVKQFRFDALSIYSKRYAIVRAQLYCIENSEQTI